MFSAAIVTILLATPRSRTSPALPVVAPSSAGMSAERLARLDGVIEEAIEKKECPGAVVLVGRHGKIVYRKAYGRRAIVPQSEPMTVDTVFDLASLTKVVATATSVMTLIESGRLRLADRVVKHIPKFGAGGGERDKVTVEELLVHRGGLPPDDPIDLYLGTPDEIFATKYRQPLASPPRTRFVYSDAGYEVLGRLVEKVSGLPLDRYARENVFEPLGMKETEFRPGGKGALPLSRIAPTETIGGSPRRGAVHDPRAFALGGVAGHAGVFSTADDLVRFCRAMLAGGRPVLSPAGVAAMTRPRFYADGDLRGLGWDVATGFSSVRGDLFPLGSFGHTGWTGTSMWLDPTTDVFVILLTNRNHPDESGNVIALRGKVATLAAAAVTDMRTDDLLAASERLAFLAATGERRGAEAAAPPQARPTAGQVKAGIDVLESQGFKPIDGKRVALLTNQTGQTRDGRPTIDVLLSERARAAGVRLVKLFSPEHGIRGELEERVPDAVHEKTGLPVRSLYGESKESHRPAPADLEGLDAVVVDLQDSGTRFYTYLTTLGYMLEETAKAKVKVVVLDRPNPIRADVVDGPPADEDTLSFTAYHTVPIRTGMTIGELARMFNAERKLGADLDVVKMTGYSRSLWYDETGLPWRNPSPNLRSPMQAALYPGVALLETTNVSVGRGTDSPFELIGAPWMDGSSLAATLSSRGIPGVRFVAVQFVPVSSAFKGQACSGVRIDLVDRDALDPVGLGLEIATALRDLHRNEWDPKDFGKLLANAAALARFARGETAREIAASWSPSRMEFERRRAAYLLY